MKSEDWVGRRIGALTIEAFEGLASYSHGKAAYFRFRCDCGRSFSAQKSNVFGKKIDCGCTRIVKRTAPAGATRHPLYKVWAHMIDRCENPANRSFKDYGGRGISVCDRWKMGEQGRSGFECFVSDMGARPDGWTIERVQVAGSYEPGNCVWLSKGDQSKNRRNVRLVRIAGEVKTIPEFCEKFGISYWTALARIKRGWPPDKAVSTPLNTFPKGVA